MSIETTQEALDTLSALQSQSLSIIRLSEPLLSPSLSQNSPASSGAALEIPSPASLEADLNHYKVSRFLSFLHNTKHSSILMLFVNAPV